MKRLVFRKLGLSVMGLLATATLVEAQEKLDASIGADVVSAYEWRGQDMGGAAVQPYAGISYKGLSLGAWSSVALDKSDRYTSELDFTVGYTKGNFTAAITDYYCLTGKKFDSGYYVGNEYIGTSTGPDFSNSKYFKYAAHSTPHMFEATLGYNFGKFALAWNTSFAGADYYKSNGDRAYSTYVEATVPFKISSVNMKAEVGLTPWEGAYSAGGDFSVINVALTASKDVKIADFKLPVYTKVGVNPRTEQTYVVFGIKL